MTWICSNFVNIFLIDKNHVQISMNSWFIFNEFEGFEMQKLLWDDCNGGIITTELLLISSVLVAGLLTALGTFRASVEGEFQQLGERIHQSTRVEKPVAASEIVAKEEIQQFQASDLPGLLD